MKYFIICIFSFLTIICCSSKRAETSISESIAVSDTIIPQSTDTNKVYMIVEQMPSYPGGENEMHRFIAENFKYPPSVMEKRIQPGRTTVRFVVTKRGHIDNIEAIRGDSTMCDSLISVIKRMPRWTPGKHNGENVDVYITIPLHVSPARR